MSDVLTGRATCDALVHVNVCIQAEVSITPNVSVGDVLSFCVSNPAIGACPGTPSPTGTCTFSVSQSICVQVPLTFSANATAVPAGIVCGTPEVGGCSSVTGCTYTIGYFNNNPTLVNALIIAAGGTIILGSGTLGASYAVTVANADAVLSGATPSPPAPASNPFAGQYQILYAQLLAANLNILNGAFCNAAVTAINDANSFIATSPSGVGKAGAPLVQQPLATFNEGNAPGCPGHCP